MRRLPSAKRGIVVRTPPSPNWPAERMVPVSKPRPSGEYGTNPIPSARVTGSIAASGCQVHSEYSDCLGRDRV